MKRYPITPTPAPRQTRRDKFDPSPPVQRYRAFRDEVGFRKVVVPTHGYHLIFVMPMPRSWSKKKRDAHRGQPHLTRPDKDNLEKALLDALYGEDSHVWDGRVSKLWGDDGAIIVAETEPLDLERWREAVASAP